MFSLQRKLSGCCWHKIQHFLDCDLLVCYKMSPGHMTCFCLAHSNSVLAIFKWRREKGRLWALVSPHRNYRPSTSCGRREPCGPRRSLVHWPAPCLGWMENTLQTHIYPIDALFRKPLEQRHAITDHSWSCCFKRNRGYNVDNLKRPPPAAHRVG